MNTLERLKRIRELLAEADPIPWETGALSNVYDKAGNRIFDSCRQSEFKGVHASNGANAEIVEHMTHLIHDGWLHDVNQATGEIAEVQDEVNQLANKLFPARTPARAFLKLYEELGEVIKDPSNPDEWADVFILIFDLSRMFGINIREAIKNKSEVLVSRVWRETSTGTYQHIPGMSVTEVPVTDATAGFLAETARLLEQEAVVVYGAVHGGDNG